MFVVYLNGILDGSVMEESMVEEKLIPMNV